MEKASPALDLMSRCLGASQHPQLFLSLSAPPGPFPLLHELVLEGSLFASAAQGLQLLPSAEVLSL